MALSVQNAGICLTGFEKERIEDISGAFDSYTSGGLKSVSRVAST